MSRFWWVLSAVIVAFGGAAMVVPAHVKHATFSTARETTIAEPFQSAVGTRLVLPSCIPSQWREEYFYSPDGTKLAVLALTSLWVIDLGENSAVELKAAADTEAQAATLTQEFFWTDDSHILVAESQNSIAEVAARMADRTAPHPTVKYRWVLFDAGTCERRRVVTDVVNADAYGLRVVGSRDADVWYIRAQDDKLRTYDSRTMAVGAETYFDYASGRGRAAQICAGSDWFSTLVPEDPNDSAKQFQGRLEVFNIATGEVREMPKARVSSPPALVTPDARYVVNCATGSDENAVPVVYDLLLGLELPIPQGERWLPMRLSVERDALLVLIPEPTAEPFKYVWHTAEVPLSYLTGL